MVPLFSVIMPVYNVERYLQRGVDSILHQDFTDYEIILVDDGSTDGSGSLCDALSQTNGCIRVVHKPNGGLADARNAGIAQAVGRYVLMPDSDDWIEPDTLRVLYDAITACEPDIVRFDLMRHSDQVKEHRTGLPAGLYLDRSKPLDMALLHMDSYWLSACTHAYRRAFLEQNELHFVSEREVLSEDYLFNLEALMVTQSLYNTGRVLYHYECREGSLTQTKEKPRRFERLTCLYQMLLAFAKDHGGDETLEKKINTFYVDRMIYHRCIVPAYKDKSAERDAVRRILKAPEVQYASHHMQTAHLSRKNRIKMLCIRWRFEPFFYHLLNK